MRTTVFFLLTLIGAAHAQSRTGLKLSEIHAGAPYILADSATRTYYLYTGAGPSAAPEHRGGILMYKSKDLQSWDGPALVFTTPRGIWADPALGASSPGVHAHQGRYFLLATLRNTNSIIEKSPPAWRTTTREATHIFAGDSPAGPFRPVSAEPPTPAESMALDGTLYFEGNVPYLVYAHDWFQVTDGGIEAVPLGADLSSAAGDPFGLFRGSAAVWLKDQKAASKAPRFYVTARPSLWKTKQGALVMLWTSQKGDRSAQAIAYSASGRIEGPWRQGEPLSLDEYSSHATVFRTFEGELMLAVRHAAGNQHPVIRLVQVEEAGAGIRVKGGAAAK